MKSPLSCAGILDHRRRTRAFGAEVSRQAGRIPGRRRSSSSASPPPSSPTRSNARCKPRPRATSPCWASIASSDGATRAALHDLHLAAGGRPQARLQCAKDHARRAAAVRGRRHRRGAVGLITYMRTDSLNLRAGSHRADSRCDRAALRKRRAGRRAADLSHQIEECPGSARGHPADGRQRSAGDIEKKLEPDQFRLYSLIWKRTVACQMAPASSIRSRWNCSPGPTARSAPCCARTARR
jgi:hypothetical protein